ncbi:MAG TPA: ABC transporter substrate-binding protein [Acidimicrobiia bacterium]|nr:ABC transporter substrate-binding protein [Acidimicrobiia bacterium]
MTDTEIHVGGIATRTNPLGTDYGQAFDGAKAYFEMVNSKGGVYGRKIRLTSERDDQLSNNRQEAQALVSEDNVFAAVPVAPILFTGADVLAQAGIPTFGWNVDAGWSGKDNLFGNVGAICFDCASAKLPLLAQRLHKMRVAILAYTAPQSADCAKSFSDSLEKYPVAKVVVDDRALMFGVTDLSADVQQMKDQKADLVATCMDQNGVLTLAREMKKQGVNAVQYLSNAYDHDFIKQYGDLFDGSYVTTPFAPFETRPRPAGLKEFDRWTKKTGAKQTELAVYGWVAADQFVQGLKAAGPDFTRQKVIDALNAVKAYDASGLIPPIDWTVQHRDQVDTACQALTKIENGKFVPVFGSAGKPFICFRNLPPKLAEANVEPRA